MNNNNELKKELKQRHMTMISIGGVIGGGLFIGSGVVINSTGPGAILAYLSVGVLIIFLMRMLGEMATVYPSSGSFSAYAHNEIGRWAGYTTGWLYWFFWAVVIPAEAMMAAAILHGWFPSFPVGILSFCIIAIMALTNFGSVKSFGEFEYWFAIIKVTAIVLFLIIGAAIILGWVPNVGKPGVSNLLDRGGFLPNGITSILVGITIVVFAFPGIEIVTIAAGESPDPQKSVMKAINSVVWRIFIFYVGSISILVTVLPWDSSALLKSPFVTVLEMVKIPYAADIMNLIILTSVLSMLNSALYTSSRMLYSLAQKGDAPRIFGRVNKNGAPFWGVIGSTFFSWVFFFSGTAAYDKIFLFLVNASGAIMLLVYLVVPITQLYMRKRLERENPEALVVKMWLFPYLTYITMASIVAILGFMLFIDSARPQLISTLVLAALILVSYFISKRSKEHPSTYEGEAQSFNKEKRSV
ncbi:amino acid permease [Niallia circulans]|uniref:amino acid permease n=1 Tax=Niallia circulans TaxID=1397 RepID=UPI003F65DC45